MTPSDSEYPDHASRRRSLSVLQLSDLHLFPYPWQTLEWGNHGEVNPERNLLALLNHVKHQYPIDAIIVTGDIAQHPAAATYSRLPELFHGMPPVFFLPGNHDDRTLFNQAVQDKMIKSLTRIRLGNWLLIGVNSCVEGEDWGYITRTSLLALERQLAHSPALNVAIAMHHFPAPTGSPWLDRIGVQNQEEFLRLLRAWKQVKCVVSGHVHQAISKAIGDLTLLACPSTAIQFSPGAIEAGYRADISAGQLLTLHPDGQVEQNILSLDVAPPQPLENPGSRKVCQGKSAQ